MPVSPHLRRKLKETLGSDAGDDLAVMLDGVDALRGDIAELRQELRQEVAKLRSDVLEAVRQLDVRIADTRADLLKWSFTFWVGAVLAIAALAGVLRWTN